MWLTKYVEILYEILLEIKHFLVNRPILIGKRERVGRLQDLRVRRDVVGSEVQSSR
jgi:hypothetical protein